MAFWYNMSWPFSLNLHSFIWIWALDFLKCNAKFYILPQTFHFVDSIPFFCFLKIWMSILASKISVFLPLWSVFLPFSWGFDSFNESPLQWWTCNLDFFVSVSDWHCRTTCLLGRSQDLCHTWSCTVESATVWTCEVVLRFCPSCVPIKPLHSQVPTTAVTQDPQEHSHCHLFPGNRHCGLSQFLLSLLLPWIIQSATTLSVQEQNQG